MGYTDNGHGNPESIPSLNTLASDKCNCMNPGRGTTHFSDTPVLGGPRTSAKIKNKGATTC